MTIDHATGEIIEYDAAAAERRAERIVLRLDAIVENYRMVLPMIREAIEKRDDIALGYRSPGDYVSDRFGQSLSGLGIEARRAVVHELTDAGLSTRAIAPVVGADHSTVVRDLRRGASAPPATVSTSTAKDALTAADPSATETAPEPPAIDSDRPTPPKLTTGIDGKTYIRPAKPRTPPRRAITDQFFDANFDLSKQVERIHRLTQDDRFPQNAEKVAARHRNDLIRTRDLLQQVIELLPSN